MAVPSLRSVRAYVPVLALPVTLGLAAPPGCFPSDSGWCPGRFASLPSPSLQSKRPAQLSSRFLSRSDWPRRRGAFPPTRAGVRAALRPSPHPRFSPSAPAQLSSRFLSRSDWPRRGALSLRLGLVSGPLCDPPLTLASVQAPLRGYPRASFR